MRLVVVLDEDCFSDVGKVAGGDTMDWKSELDGACRTVPQGSSRAGRRAPTELQWSSLPLVPLA